jgi:hypothetical protein
MQIPACSKLLGVFVFFALTVLFFGNQNSVFASDAQWANQVAVTTLSRPGTPYISGGENSLKPIWSWDASKSLISGPIYYLVQWCPLPDFSGCEDNRMYAQSNSFSFDFSNQLTNGIWYMRVRAMDEFGHTSAYSATGLGTFNYFSLVTPYNFTVSLSGNEAKLLWYDCFAANFRVWASNTGENGNYKMLGETESYGFSSNLGTFPVRWFYVTAYDKWGNESPPSAVIKVKIPGLQEANVQTLDQDWAAIFEPIWRDFSFKSGQVAGDRTNNAVPIKEDENGGFLGIIPHDYFKLN